MEPKTPASSFRTLANELPPISIGDDPPALQDRVHPRTSVGTPSKPVLGLPLARWIPMDMHSVMDYANGLVAASCTMLTDDDRARLASLALASSVIGVSAVTDYRLSVAKLVPIEAHEVIDHVWGLSAIAAPFVLGYWKTAPKVALMHVVAGLGTCLAALVTDYRAYSKRTSQRTPR